MEPPRLLARRSEYGYTDRPDLALNREPEAVPRGDQKRITADAARRADHRRREHFHDARRIVDDELLQLQQTYGALVSNEVRCIRRELDRLARKLAS